MFVQDQHAGSGAGQPSQQKPDQSRPKRPRSSLACIRCRKKKVKCDFVQPTCGRCSIAGLPCSYATPPRRVDGHAFDQLGNHVEELKERMQKMQSELAKMKNNLHPFNPSSSNASGSNQTEEEDNRYSPNFDPLSQHQFNPRNSMSLIAPPPQMPPAQQQPVTWKLSLSPSGLRIDTNIASVADLYRILLNGISQLNINTDSTNLFSTDSIRGEGSKSRSKGWNKKASKAIETAGPAGAAGDTKASPAVGVAPDSTTGNAQGRLWEVDDREARAIQQERIRQKNESEGVPQHTLDHLMHNTYHRCFLAYEIVDKETFMEQYSSVQGLDPLLLNSIYAWASKHGCIYHNVNSDRDPTTMGDPYFKNARQLLKKCFDVSSPTTIHALLNLYMYQLSSERSSLAYLYIGLAIRMAQDLKYHKKDYVPADPKQRETSKRLWWSAYWLDLCAALESNRPTMVDDKDCDIDYPVKLDSEDDETGYRIDFCVHSIKLMKIRKDITKHLPSEQSGQSLLSAISKLENSLTNWLNELPQYLHFEQDETLQKTGTFCDEARLILNIQYQTTWIMLHQFFLPKVDQTATPVALLSLNICTKSANFITRMLDIYANNLSWCQFFHNMDGIIASVGIHQVNAQSSEKEVALLAKRNLIITSNVLRDSPLVYMEKINEIIDSIDEYMRKNNFPTDLNQLPAVNENSVNGQSIQSVFHPAIFETSPKPKASPNSGSLNQFGQMKSPQANHQPPSMMSPGMQGMGQASQKQQQQQQQQPKVPGGQQRIPNQQGVRMQGGSFQQQQQQQQQQNNTGMPTNAGMQNIMTSMSMTSGSFIAPQMQNSGQLDSQNSADSVLLDSNMQLFNDPSLVDGFNIDSGNDNGNTDMSQLLFRNVGVNLVDPSGNLQNAQHLFQPMSSPFEHQAPNAFMSSPQAGQQNFGSSSRTPTPSASFNQSNVPTSTAGPNYFDQSRPHPQQYQNYLGAHNLFQNMQQQQQQQQQQHGSQQQSQAQQTSPQPFASSMMGRPPFAGQPTQLGIQNEHGDQQSPSGTGFVGGDTGNFFDQMNMDPATMSALFYGTPVVGNGPEGYGDFSFGNGGQDLGGFTGLDPNLQQQQMGSSAASRKRVHPPEWDENA
ncbi:unnamed protein product [Umbelopsis ramanniana]